MNIRVLSDLHNEISIYHPQQVKSYVVVLTEDINLGVSGSGMVITQFSGSTIHLFWRKTRILQK